MTPINRTDNEARSADVIAQNIEVLKGLFPEAVSEGKLDLSVLKGLIGAALLPDEERDEKYGLNWFGKRKARQIALTPSTGTLRPCKEDSVDWDTTKNLMIEGDNLEVLKLLQKSYAGQVKLIYIDPPYNTGKDFVYPDNFQDNIKNYLEQTGQLEGGAKMQANTEASGRFHTDWLNMIYPRLKMASTLLHSDGTIVISIDEKEVQNLKYVCNEIFGEENFVALITLLCNPKGRSQDKYFATNHEYLMIYSKTVRPKGHYSVMKDEDQIGDEYPLEDDGGKYRLLELRNTHREFGKHNRKNLYYPFYVTIDGEVLLASDDDTEKVLPIWDDGFEGCWTWEKAKANRDIDYLVAQQINGRWKIYRKSYANGADKMLKTIFIDKLFYTERGQKEFNQLFATKAKLFQSPKSPYLISLLVSAMTKENDIVLDFFAGSGTTGHSVMMNNADSMSSRRFILVQLPEVLDPESPEQRATVDFLKSVKRPYKLTEITKERLRRAGKKIQAEMPTIDIGFKVFKLDTSNILPWEPEWDLVEEIIKKSVDHIKEGRLESDILYELLLKLGLDLAVPIEQKAIESKRVYSIGVGTLIVCLDKKISRSDAEPLALGIVEWHKELATVGETTCVFLDSGFADDVAKTNLSAILNQHGLANVRSL